MFPVLAVIRVGARQIGAGAAPGLDDADKISHPLLEETFGAEAVSGELSVTTFEEVFGDHAADMRVVHTDEGASSGEVGGAQFDGWEACGSDNFGGFAGECPGEDAVAVPVSKPFGRGGVGAAQFEKSGPWAMCCDVASDTGKQFAGVGAGRLDEERDAWDGAAAGGHGGRIGWSDAREVGVTKNLRKGEP